MSFRIVIAQIKPRKADYIYNLSRVAEVMAQVDRMEPQPDVLVLPETILSGYFLEGGVREAARSQEELFQDLHKSYQANCGPWSALDIVLGFYEGADGIYYNSGMYARLAGHESSKMSRIIHVHRKFFLPTYGVF